MKVLFLYRGKSEAGDNRVVVTQGRSLEAAGVEIDYFPLTGRGPGSYLRAISDVRRRLGSSGADIVHAHYGISGFAGWLAAGRRPVVVSFMGSDLLGSQSRRGGITAGSRLVSLFSIVLARWCYSLSVVKSFPMREKLLRNTPCAVIPNGVDIRAFCSSDRLGARSQLNLDPDEYLVLFPSGRDNPEKNYDLASLAVGRLGERGFRLLEVNNAGREEMNLLFNAADMLLVTSFHEGSPNVVKEAMACGCPVVSTDVGDIAWLFGQTPGHFLSVSDAAEMSVAIEAAARFRREHGFTTGRERIMQLGLDSVTVAGIIKDHYSRLITGKK